MRKKSTFTRSVRHTSVKRSVFRALALCAGALFLAGCGLLSGPDVTPTPTRPMAAVVPTFTSTPVGAAAAQESGGGATVQQAAPAAAQPQAPQATDTPRPTDTPVPTAARFTVKTDLTAANVNVRTGPSTAFGIIAPSPEGRSSISAAEMWKTPGISSAASAARQVDFLGPGKCGERESDHGGCEHPGHACSAHAYAGAHTGATPVPAPAM